VCTPVEPSRRQGSADPCTGTTIAPLTDERSSASAARASFSSDSSVTTSSIE